MSIICLSIWLFNSENGLVDAQETNEKKETPAEVTSAQPAQPTPAAAPQQESPIQSGPAEPRQPTQAVSKVTSIEETFFISKCNLKVSN